MLICLGFEIIRVGTSGSQMEECGAVIEHNLFEECNGEIEIISLKCTGSVVRHNTFSKSYGYVTMRHGNRHIVVSATHQNYCDKNYCKVSSVGNWVFVDCRNIYSFKAQCVF